MPIAETTELSWTTDPLTPGASYRFAVRVRDIATGLEEENLDATTSLILAADGQDATKLPSPPFGLRAIDQGSGKVRFEWTTSPSNHPPTHFNLYIGRDGMLEFTSPTTIPIATMRGEVMATEVHGLMDGMPLAAVIRAVNSHGEEGNVRSIRFTVDHTPPERVDGLAASISTNLD